MPSNVLYPDRGSSAHDAGSPKSLKSWYIVQTVFQTYIWNKTNMKNNSLSPLFPVSVFQIMHLLMEIDEHIYSQTRGKQEEEEERYLDWIYKFPAQFDIENEEKILWFEKRPFLRPATLSGRPFWRLWL